jgi:O-antigen ligase
MRANNRILGVDLGFLCALSMALFLYTPQFESLGVRITLPGLIFFGLATYAGMLNLRAGSLGRHPLIPAVLFFLIAIVLSGSFAIDIGAWLKETLHVVVIFITIAGVSTALRDRSRLKGAMEVYIGVMGIVGLWGIYQFETGSGPSEPEPMRACANMGPMFAQFIYPALIFGITLYPLSRSGPSRLLVVCSICVLSIALVFSLTRGALICTLISLFVLLCIRTRGYLVPVSLTILMMSVAVVHAGVFIAGQELLGVPKGYGPSKPNPTLQRLAPHGSYTTSYRLFLWESAMGFYKESPITGIGFNNFKARISLQERRYVCKLDWTKEGIYCFRRQNEDPHNFYLRLLAETGIIGLMAWLFLIVRFVSYLWVIRWDELGAGVVALIFGWLFFALIGTLLAGALSTLFALICAMGLALRRGLVKA